ncbi:MULTISPECIES: tryptophan--tRNA ligase [unclassified Flavonifractor]|uniref:tryptophan--tRNA ligase n=1 Tax=unclassified Flavonifractor TaxID=2629267 RepID=UPI000B389CB4|nr:MULTISPECIES: tryptophan--tRNA ligase [unclassified Flavonifractor]OUN11906.1 tryptophan--tRNA ligase [Flavonifractor sp. An91]OUN13052.1 tryptophan--tRNA ligase [Flavonifractor sp. An9]OUN84600.1 tryptophan--tRNA ligase [Flavonifractor sp. An52]OUO17663.1 tryptophan--tRNA ligase [Flavonifractor sp. An4]
METNKKVIFSGIQPSGALHLGNYLGALRNWVALQDEYNCVYCVVDEHAITVRQDPAALRRQTIELFAQLVACGIDPEKSILFIQSHVPAHAELAWVLNCYTMFGELSRMTQFKDKSAKHADNVNAGLFTYPSLMAADIMLYQADLVPVGEDQKQHVELTRNIVQRFNGIYGDVFTMPDAYIPKVGARVMSLNQPDSKMSKSIPEGCVYLMDSPDDIMRKFKRAITDSDTENCVRYDRANKPGVATLIDIYAAVTGKTYEQIEVEFEGKGYGAFKPAVGEAVVELLRPVREETVRLLGDKAYLEGLYRAGAEKAASVAQRTLRKVHKKVGFIPR